MRFRKFSPSMLYLCELQLFKKHIAVDLFNFGAIKNLICTTLNKDSKIIFLHLDRLSGYKLFTISWHVILKLNDSSIYKAVFMNRYTVRSKRKKSSGRKLCMGPS